MIIDAHTHIGPKIIVADADKLIRSMDDAGIDASLVFAGNIYECSTQRLLASIAGHRDRLLPVGLVSPLTAGANAVQDLKTQLQKRELVAVKFYPGYEHFFPTDHAVRPYLELLAQYGVPAIFHSGDCHSKVGGAKLKYAHPLHIDELAVDMPNLTIIMAHMGNPWTLDGAEVCYKNGNVYADCSGFISGEFTPRNRESFIRTVRDFMEYVEDSKKLLFGTDWPIVTSQQAYANAMRDALRDMIGTSDLVFSGNAIRVFNLKLPARCDEGSAKILLGK
jgi:predicted TIM-barrel fold metal-dependent hydrolase